MERVKECYKEIDLPSQEENIDRVHSIGKTYTDKNTGKKVKSIIVKFNSWKSLQQFYNARPKHFTNNNNAKCSKWCSSDKNNIAGLEIDNITTTAGYSQLINKPTHFINETSSCIELIFSSNVSFIRSYGMGQSIYEKCHHNIAYGTLDFNVPVAPPYYREIWDYKNADTESIQKAISNFDWPKAFRNKNAN